MNRIELTNGYIEYTIHKSFSSNNQSLLECGVILYFLSGKSNFAGILIKHNDAKSDIESQFELSNFQCDYINDVSLGISEEFKTVCEKEIEKYNINFPDGLPLEIVNMSHSGLASSNSTFRLATRVALGLISQSLANEKIDDNYVLKLLNNVRQFNLKLE